MAVVLKEKTEDDVMMANLIRDYGKTAEAAYRFAPQDWSEQYAERLAHEQGLALNADHFEAMRALQEYFAKHDKPEVRIRELHDALDERFHGRGGMRYLYTLFPGGPVAQGCRLAGLPIPAGAQNLSFGSVQ